MPQAPPGADDLCQTTSVKQEHEGTQVVHPIEVQEDDFFLSSQSNEHHDNLLSVNGLLPSYIDVVDTLASTVVELEHDVFVWGPGHQGPGRAGAPSSDSISRRGAQKGSLSDDETDLDEDGVDSFFSAN